MYQALALVTGQLNFVIGIEGSSRLPPSFTVPHTTL